jgi:hypothetical protein
MKNDHAIALFMGYIDNGCSTDGFLINPDTNYDEDILELNYRSSWEKLMPVIEKICRLDFNDNKISFLCFPRTFGMVNEDTGKIMVRLNGFSLHEADTLIEATYLAVVEYVRYYLGYVE